MNQSVFEANDYKAYLNDRLDDPSRGGGRGARARLSKAIGCQTAYTAQVLRGTAHFSLEQAESINAFLGHSDEESHFFLLLVQVARAGSGPLRQRFEREIARLQEARLFLKNRLGVKQPLGHEDQVIYYSSWQYAAIHALVSIPKLRAPQSLSRRLGLEMGKINEALSFLSRSGILEETAHGYKIGTARIHLGADSPLVAKHHINWRLQAIRALEGDTRENLHYSSVISLSESDASRIRELLIKALETIKPIVRDSAEETGRCLNIDFFKI